MKFRHAIKLYNIKLLKDDERYIEKLLMTQPKTTYKDLLTGYIDAWRKARDECSDVNGKDNVGRHAANTWLRNVINSK